MLENIDLSRKVGKAEYKRTKDRLELKLAALQRRAIDLNIPVIIIFEGWHAAGKGRMINELILPLDPRGFDVHSALPPNDEEALRPFLWRFWIKTPARGRITIFDRCWYRRILYDWADGIIKPEDLPLAYQDIISFERQLADDGNIIIKFFLHITKAEQKHRFDKLRKQTLTAWRVTQVDIKRHKQYDRYRTVIEDMLAQTDSDFAPWTIIEAHDRRFASLKILSVVVNTLENYIADIERAAPPSRKTETATLDESLHMSILDKVDLTREMKRPAYRKQLKRKQKRLRQLEHEIYVHRVPVVIVFEGWDAAGKGGNIRRLTQRLDPRGYEVVSVAAPNDIEKAHHYLWRFWTRIPKAGHITIFDRSWYGRVLVERLEGFCSKLEWQRAYREINEMEKHLSHSGTVLLKFWLHIHPDEQLRRFRERQRIPHKQWKITDEDWRNREKWDAYKTVVEEMLFRTSTPVAPWIIVESNCKRNARIKVLDTVIAAIEQRLNQVRRSKGKVRFQPGRSAYRPQHLY
ncbi:MAG: polyphosphate:AMP phosphotransferase [Candidatus Poribacteria bacterium]|nr:polyphosphate:AMP phosphotransferase [Candidatus Poribacteria bacterium]